MPESNGPTKVQKSRASKNSLYMTIFILLITLIFALPTCAYVYMANTHKPDSVTKTDKQVQKMEQDKLPKPKKAKKKSSTKIKNNTTSSRSTSATTYDMYGNVIEDSSTSSINNTMATTAAYNDGIEAENTYTVQQGDNLYRIAINHGMTQQELMDLNGLTAPVVSVGQVLRVK